MNTENVKNEFENGGWQKEAEQTMNDREKMDELKNKKNKSRQFMKSFSSNGLLPTKSLKPEDRK